MSTAATTRTATNTSTDVADAGYTTTTTAAGSTTYGTPDGFFGRDTTNNSNGGVMVQRRVNPNSAHTYDGNSDVLEQGADSSADDNNDDDDDDDVALFQDDERYDRDVDRRKNKLYYDDVSNWAKVEPQSYKCKPKSIRRFYQQQNMLIENLQSFYQAVPTSEEEADHDHGSENSNNEHHHEPVPVAIAIYVSFGLNVVLLIIKIIASVWSDSMSVIASAADSLLDLLSGTVLVIAHRLVVKKRTSMDAFRYPQGRSRMEPIGVFAFAIIMMLSSTQIIIEAVRRLVSRPEIELGPTTLAILAFTIVSKAVAAGYCRRVARKFRSAAAAAYANDHRNDVMTNTVGVGAALLAAVYVPSLWFLDSTGAIAIAIYIMANWLRTGNEQLRFLTGRGASPMLLNQLTYIAANHDARIKYLDTVRAYHFGVHYLVEIDIVLAEDMSVRESHDIGESLQHRLEQLEDVERAFVHIDYEWEHSPVVFRGTRIIRK